MEHSLINTNAILKECSKNVSKNESRRLFNFYLCLVGGLGGKGGNLVPIVGLDTNVPIILSTVFSVNGGNGFKSGSESVEDGGD